MFAPTPRIFALLSIAGLWSACKPESVVDEWTRESAPVSPKPDKTPAKPLVDIKPLVPEEMFASAELRAIEATKQLSGRAQFFRAPGNAILHLKVAGLTAGSYGIYLGRDCRPAPQPLDPVPGDKKGLGSSPPRIDELKVGTLSVDQGGEVEITVAVPADRAEDPPLSERTVILMPEAVEGLGRPQTRSACGEIIATRAGS